MSDREFLVGLAIVGLTVAGFLLASMWTPDKSWLFIVASPVAAMLGLLFGYKRGWGDGIHSIREGEQS